MAKQYYIKKDPSASGADIEWIAINGKDFYQLITSPAGKGRYFIDMDDFMIEANETEYAEWRKEKNHSDYLRSQELDSLSLSFFGNLPTDVGDGAEVIPDKDADTEGQALLSITLKALNQALSRLDTESYMLIEALILSEHRKSERDLACEYGLSQKAINKRKKRILRTLKFLVLKAEKSQQ